MTNTDPRVRHPPAWLLRILTGLNLFNSLDRFVLSAVLTPLQKDLVNNDEQSGRLVTAFMIGYFFIRRLWLARRPRLAQMAHRRHSGVEHRHRPDRFRGEVCEDDFVPCARRLGQCQLRDHPSAAS